MNWFKYSSNQFIITHYNRTYGEIGVVTDKGKEYEYKEISPFFYDKIKRLVSQKRFGEGWQLLRKFPETEK